MSTRNLACGIVLDVLDATVRELRHQTACRVQPRLLSEERGPGFVIRQLEVFPQRLLSGGCGHHALHNARCALAAVRAELAGDADGASAAYSALTSAPLFFQSYRRSLAALRKHCAECGNGWYPWRLRDVNNGVVERSHMLHLLGAASPNADEALTPLPDACTASIANGALEIEAASVLDAKLQGLSHGDGTGCTAVVVGVIRHWVAIVAYRAAQGQPLQLVLLDSRNKPVLGATRDPARVAVEFFDELVRRGKCFKRPREMLQREYQEELEEVRTISLILADSGSGGRRLSELCVVAPIQRTISGFF